MTHNQEKQLLTDMNPKMAQMLVPKDEDYKIAIGKINLLKDLLEKVDNTTR